MSVVTGVVLCTASSESEQLWDSVNFWLEEYYGSLVRLEETFGGTKHPQMHVGGGGFNYLPAEAFKNHVLSLSWAHPDSFVLILKPEEGRTKVYTL